MASLRHIFKPVNVAEEREFEKENVSRKLERYLRTNPLVRFETDAAYRVKVQRIQKGLEKDHGRLMEGLILDIGGNTAGEATILQQQGLNFIVGDINEVALDISRQRVKKFCLLAPEYVALDAHELPFADESFSAVTVIEALHHFPDYSRVLGEILRVVKPGGIFYSNEPNGLNPIRRLSEARDRLRGTIEKSFFVGQLKRLCRAAGFTEISIHAVSVGKSSWKLEEVPRYRRSIYRLHGFLQTKIPRFFGTLEIRARKGGTLSDAPVSSEAWRQSLRSPVNGTPLRFDEAAQRWLDAAGNSFPQFNGIPVLLRSDSLKQTH